jgi:hypothetical protein
MVVAYVCMLGVCVCVGRREGGGEPRVTSFGSEREAALLALRKEVSTLPDGAGLAGALLGCATKAAGSSALCTATPNLKWITTNILTVPKYHGT